MSLPVQTTNLVQILMQVVYNSILCQKGLFTIQPCPVRCFFWQKYVLLIPHEKSKLKILHRNVCLSKKEVLMKLPIQKTDRSSPGLVPDGKSFLADWMQAFKILTAFSNFSTIPGTATLLLYMLKSIAGSFSGWLCTLKQMKLWHKVKYIS